jgi:hypothetical protein
MHTAKLLFAMRPKICAQQRSERTAIIDFPVVWYCKMRFFYSTQFDLYDRLKKTRT